MFKETDKTNKTGFRRYAPVVCALMFATVLTACGQKIATVAANTDAVPQQNADLPEVVVNGSRSHHN